MNAKYFVSYSLISPQCTKARLKVTEKELKDLKWEHEVLEQRFIKVSGCGRPQGVLCVNLCLLCCPLFGNRVSPSH